MEQHEDDLHIGEYMQAVEDGTMTQFLPPEVRTLVDAGRPWVFLLKWTCPKCKERCTSNLPNTIETDGYEHTFRENGEYCGEVYRGGRIGLTAMVGITAEQATFMLANREDDLL